MSLCRYFPIDGEIQQVFLTNVQLPEDLPKLDFALRKLRDQSDILNTLEAWYFAFEDYYNENLRESHSEHGLNVFFLLY